MPAPIRPEDLLRLQQDLIERISRAYELRATLDALCHVVQELIPDSICSVMRLDPVTGELNFISAPCALDALLEELDGLVPGKLAGSCGSAAHTGEMAIVGDTRIDPRWKELQSVVRTYDLLACWSIPFLSKKGEVLGTFAISRTVTGEPDEAQLRVLRTAGNLAGIAIACDSAEVALHDQKELLDGILEATEDPIFAKDRKGRYLLVNSAEAKGVRQSRAEMVGLRDKDLYPAKVAAHNERTDAEVIASAQGLHYELEYDNSTEGKRAFLIRKSPLLGSDGKPKGIVGVARDITALKRAEEAMRQTQKLESLGVLAGGIAHDFNNLLTGILGNAELLLEGRVADTPIHSGLLEIKHAAIRASELTNQMLAYSGQGEFIKRIVHLPNLVNEVAALLASSISKQAELVFEIDPELPSIEADPTQIRQLVLNILTNASEALEGRPGLIRVRMRRTERVIQPRATHEDEQASGCFVAFEVTDSGSGMDEETRERIFDPFFTTKFAGRGLGLAGVQGIVRGHRGSIEVVSEPGRGTTFTVYLPASRMEPDEPPEATADWDAWRGSGTILVADDEEAVRRLAVRVLEDAGLKVRTAVDGQEAVDIFAGAADDFAAVILDLTTPRLDGREACRQLLDIRSDVPIILSSGYTERDATQKFRARELAGFLQKPYLPRELVDLVRRVL